MARPTQLRPAAESMTLLVAAVIVHDLQTQRVVGSRPPINAEPDKHAQVAWLSTDAIPEEFVSTTNAALRSYLGGGPSVSLDSWGLDPAATVASWGAAGAVSGASGSGRIPGRR